MKLIKLVVVAVLTTSSLASFAELTVLTGKKIECRDERDGEVKATFVLDSPENQSNELADVLQTFNVRYTFSTLMGPLSSSTSVKKVTETSPISFSAISTKKISFEMNGRPYFRIVILRGPIEIDYFQVETNLNTIGSMSAGMSLSDNGRNVPKDFGFCQQTNENL